MEQDDPSLPYTDPRAPGLHFKDRADFLHYLTRRNVGLEPRPKQADIIQAEKEARQHHELVAQAIPQKPDDGLKSLIARVAALEQGRVGDMMPTIFPATDNGDGTASELVIGADGSTLESLPGGRQCGIVKLGDDQVALLEERFPGLHRYLQLSGGDDSLPPGKYEGTFLGIPAQNAKPVYMYIFGTSSP